MRLVKYIFVFSIILFLISCSEDSSDSPLSGGDGSSTISGTIVDQDQEPVAGVKVTAYNLNDESFFSEASATTNSEGVYSLEVTAENNYEVKVYHLNPNYPDRADTVTAVSGNITINFTITTIKDQIVSGTVTDLNNNPLEGITIQLRLLYDAFGEDKITATTNSSGYYEILNDHQSYHAWGIEAVSDQYNFESDQEPHGEIMTEAVEVNFTQIEDYINSWHDIEIADSSADGTVSALIIFTEDAFRWYEYDSNDNNINYFGSDEFTITKSSGGNIHEIAMKVRYTDGSLAHDFKGIFSIEKNGADWTLTIEMVDLLKSGYSAPTVSGGFGSANGVAHGDAWVWKFTNSNSQSLVGSINELN